MLNAHCAACGKHVYLNLDGIRRTPLKKLGGLIRSSGYFRHKARRLKNFVNYLDARYAGSLERMFGQPTGKLREELLALNGIGPETADSVLLYAGGHAVFVVDAYTRRVFERHGLITSKTRYEDIRQFVENAFQQSHPFLLDQAPTSPLAGRPRHKFALRGATAPARSFDEFHALLVQAGKHHCLKAGRSAVAAHWKSSWKASLRRVRMPSAEFA